MMARGGVDFWTARQRALQLLDTQITGQASVIAYAKVYVLSALIIVALIPLLVLVRRTKSSGGGHMIME